MDKELLREYSEGIIALTACLGGEVQARLLSGNIEAAERIARDYQGIFGEDFFLEIQDQGFEAERLIIPLQYELSRRTGIPLVATNDSHYLNHEDADLHDTLLCIGTKTFKSAQRRMRFSTDQFFAKTPEEMAAVFGEHPEVLERTLEIAARSSSTPSPASPSRPSSRCPPGTPWRATSWKWPGPASRTRIEECRPLWQRGVLKYTEDKYRARLAFELDTVLSMGFPGYFLLVWDFIRKAREMGVPVGPGRGSAAGSIVAWSMHITDIDPMQYDLLFERFLNPERISMPDVDIDFCRDGRQKVIDYVTETYGKDRVSNIVTINQLKTKAVIKDVARVFEKDFAFANNLTKLVPQEPGKPITVAQALEQSEKLRELYESDPEVKNILDISARLEGLARNTGVHAAGVIIAPDDLTKFAPLSRDKDGKVMVQYSMMEAERAGLLKMDFLGLETLTQIAKTQGYIARTHGRPVDMLTIRTFDDKRTFDLFSQGDTDGIFQFESGGMKQLLRNLRPDRFDDLIALNALFRPGPLGAGMGETYVNCRHGREPVTYMFPSLEPILAPTYGVILYQEQVMQIASLIAGYSLGEADMLRRAMGKKDFAKMAKEKSKFIDQGAERGYDRAKVSELFDLIEYFAGYGFNKCIHGSTRVVHAGTGEVRTVEELFRAGRPWTIHALGRDGRLRARKVEEVVANGRKPVFRITTAQGRRIVATANHPFLTVGGWTLLEDLRPGDRIAAPRALRVATEKAWPAHELVVLGGLLSEGNTCHPEADAKRIPDEVFTLRDEDLELLLGRLWSGDGSLGDAKLKVPYYATSSRELGWGVQLLLSRLGILSGIHEKTFRYRGGTRTGYCVHLCGEHALDRFLERIGPHLLGRGEQLEVLRAHVQATERGLTSIDTVPAAVRVHVAQARETLGLTWKDVEARSGLSMKEFYGKGSAGKRGFRRGTLARLGAVLDSEALTVHGNSDVFWDRVSLIEPMGEEETYDLCIQDDHNFVADGLIVHNSHSAAYALVAYETAYLKANFLTEFMAGLLSTKSNRTDDVVKYIQNCRELGLEVLGPDINQSELDFTITGANQIRFGFAAVKGLGEAALEAILAARAQEGGFKDFFHALKVDRPAEGQPPGLGVPDQGRRLRFHGGQPGRPGGGPAFGPGERRQGRGGHRHDLAVRRGRNGQPGRQLVPARGRGALVAQGAPALRAGDPGPLRLRPPPGGVQGRPAGAHRGLHRRAQGGRRRGPHQGPGRGEPGRHGEQRLIQDQRQGRALGHPLPGGPHRQGGGAADGRPFRPRHPEAHPHLRAVPAPGPARRAPAREGRTEGRDLRQWQRNGNGNGGDEDEEEQTVIKLFVTGLESLEDFQGKGFSGAVVRLPKGRYPDRLLPLLRLYHGPYPLHLEFQGQDGIVARIKAGPELGLRFDPDLSDRVAKEAGCTLSWTY